MRERIATWHDRPEEPALLEVLLLVVPRRVAHRAWAANHVRVRRGVTGRLERMILDDRRVEGEPKRVQARIVSEAKVRAGPENSRSEHEGTNCIIEGCEPVRVYRANGVVPGVPVARNLQTRS